ncbi:MAG TPA: ABC transporter substrate-binding protein [Atopostipes sp.]|nr:ABC transporter substrate-binding protein [Atopostipes sp.]
MDKMKRFLLLSLTAIALFFLAACQSEDTADNEGDTTTNTNDLTEIEFILDWVPNTNHTGVFVAEEMGYFEEAGLDVTIRRPPEGSVTELVGTGSAQFGIDFQDMLAARFEQGVPVTAVAAIIEENTAGIISHAEDEIERAADIEGKSYGTWNDPIELALLEHIMEEDGGDFEQVELVPNQADNSVVGLANDMFDSANIYFAWDGIMAEHQEVPTNFFYFTDYAEELNFYSPVIIANNEYLETNPEEAEAFVQAVKRGYQYAMENPEESAELLIENAPELEDQRDFVVASQKWISEQYAENSENWGMIEEDRWNAFYTWLLENELIETDLTEDTLFTNEFLGE